MPRDIPYSETGTPECSLDSNVVFSTKQRKQGESPLDIVMNVPFCKIHALWFPICQIVPYTLPSNLFGHLTDCMAFHCAPIHSILIEKFLSVKHDLKKCDLTKDDLMRNII